MANKERLVEFVRNQLNKTPSSAMHTIAMFQEVKNLSTELPALGMPVTAESMKEALGLVVEGARYRDILGIFLGELSEAFSFSIEDIIAAADDVAALLKPEQH